MSLDVEVLGVLGEEDPVVGRKGAARAQGVERVAVEAAQQQHPRDPRSAASDPYRWSG